MKILKVYALLICIVAVITFSISSGIAIYDSIEIIQPKLTLKYYQYSRHQSNEAFTGGRKQFEKKTEEEITKIREKSYKVALDTERRGGFQSLLRMLIVMLVNAVLFLIHWKMVKKATNSINSLEQKSS